MTATLAGWFPGWTGIGPVIKPIGNGATYVYTVDMEEIRSTGMSAYLIRSHRRKKIFVFESLDALRYY
jgi:hypothetical protein